MCVPCGVLTRARWVDSASAGRSSDSAEDKRKLHRDVEARRGPPGDSCLVLSRNVERGEPREDFASSDMGFPPRLPLCTRPTQSITGRIPKTLSNICKVCRSRCIGRYFDMQVSMSCVAVPLHEPLLQPIDGRLPDGVCKNEKKSRPVDLSAVIEKKRAVAPPSTADVPVVRPASPSLSRRPPSRLGRAYKALLAATGHFGERF